MKLGNAHLIRQSTLSYLEGEIQRLNAENERLHRLSKFRLVGADPIDAPEPPATLPMPSIASSPSVATPDTAKVSAELSALRQEHEHESMRISRQYRVRIGQAVAEMEAAIRRLARAQGNSAESRRLAPEKVKNIPTAQPPANPVFLRESPLAHALLDGMRGIEIGAGAHSPWGLQTRNVGLTPELDPEDFEMCKQYQIAFCGTWAPVDIAGDAENVPLPNSSEDFVIHAHVWEHLANPLKGLREWTRVVKPGGVIFAIVPKRDTVACDATLPVTPLSEHVMHYLLNSDYSHRVNYEDPTRYPGRGCHISRFTLESLREIGVWFNEYFQGPRLEELAALETDDKVGNGHLIAWRVHKNHP